MSWRWWTSTCRPQLHQESPTARTTTQTKPSVSASPPASRKHSKVSLSGLPRHCGWIHTICPKGVMDQNLSGCRQITMSCVSSISTWRWIMRISLYSHPFIYSLQVRRSWWCWEILARLLRAQSWTYWERRSSVPWYHSPSSPTSAPAHHRAPAVWTTSGWAAPSRRSILVGALFFFKSFASFTLLCNFTSITDWNVRTDTTFSAP